MRTLDLAQHSDEWHEARAKHYTASEASVLMGAHPSISRNDLLRAYYSGAESEISQYVRERIFADGHAAEAACRPGAEAEIDEELFPATVVDDDGVYLASLDGITMDETTTWEHKQFNQEKVAHMEDTGECPPEDYWQVTQQLMITGAERCLYSVGNDPDTMVKVWVHPDAAAFEKLRAAWHQFQQDLDNYEPPEEPEKAVGKTMESLPALHIEVTGEVTASNLAEYKSHALAVFDAINTDLQTDQDFADAEQAVKWCKEVEDRLDGAKQHALSQTQTIDELFRAIDDIKESARQKRLELDKRVKERKTAIRDEIRRTAETTLRDHIAGIEKGRFDHRVSLPKITADFAGAMKNKRTIRSLRDSVDQVLANAKIEANEIADRIQANLKAFDEIAADHGSLFPDLPEMVHKQNDDFTAAVRLRISEYERKEEQRREAERARIREEEQAKARAAEQARAESATEAPPADPAPTPPAPQSPPSQPHKGDDTVSWLVVCTLRIEVPGHVKADDIKAQTQKRLTDAGIGALQNVTCQREGATYPKAAGEN